jgi:putative ABC transport system permease protein
VTAIGLAVGIAAAFALGAVLASALVSVSPHDPLVFVLAPLFLASAMFAACWIPARRAARIDPTEALRVE